MSLTTRMATALVAAVVLVIVLCAGWVATTFSAQTLPVAADFTVVVPEANPPAEMTIAALPAGKIFADAALAFRGGSFSDHRVFVVGGILVQHPQGAVLFDAGFGKNVETHAATNPWLAQKLMRYEREPTVAEQLAAAGIAPGSLRAIVLTHAHWDHVSGIEDLPGVPVMVTAAEMEFVRSDDRDTVLARRIGSENYRTYEFTSGPYLGFDRSYDMFGDGSVVIVPASGHTPGSIVAFITMSSKQRYALVGDLVWQREGIDLPAERPWLTRSLADKDEQSVRNLIVHLHQLQKSVPNLTVVPAHDSRVWDTLPRLQTQAGGSN